MSKFGYFPKSEEDFLNYLHELENKPHDYNSIAEALTDATVAFFNYFASKHGMTGYQASWSALQFLAKTRGMEAPFMIVDYEKLLEWNSLFRDLLGIIEAVIRKHNEDEKA